MTLITLTTNTRSQIVTIPQIELEYVMGITAGMKQEMYMFAKTIISVEMGCGIGD